MVGERERRAGAALAAARRKYDRLRRAVERAGFFAPHVQLTRGWASLTCTSRYARGRGYTGLILRVTRAAGAWYISTMHPHHYRVRHPRRVARVCIALLGRERRPRGVRPAAEVDLASELLPVPEQEFLQAVGLPYGQ